MKKIPGRPNIFDLATKELTMDAMVAWLLSSCNSDKLSYQKLGKDFIQRFLLERKCEDIRVEVCKLQYNRMDVFAVIYADGLYYPIIFEDKVHTTLHSGKSGKQGQLVKYCKDVYAMIEKEISARADNKNITVSGRSDILKEIKKDDIIEWGEIHYIYFKLGYIHNGDKFEYERQKNQLTKYAKYSKCMIFKIKGLKDILEILRDNNARMTDDLLFKDYYNYLKDENKRFERLTSGWNDKGEVRRESLMRYVGQNQFFMHALGYSVKCQPGTSYGGSKYLFYEVELNDKILPFSENRKKIQYMYYFKTKKVNKTDYPVFAFRQYREESKTKAMSDERIEEYNKVFIEIEKIIKRILDTPIHKNIKEVVTVKQDINNFVRQNTKDIFEILIDDNTESEDVCRFLRDVHEVITNQSEETI